MIDMQAVLAVFTVYIVGVVIPGPNFVAVAHKAVSARRSEAFALVAGIVLVNRLGEQRPARRRYNFRLVPRWR